MHVKKSHNKQKVAKFNPDRDLNLFEALMDEVVMSDQDHISREGQVIAQLSGSAMNAAIDLSRLVIENRIHNSEKMNDEDIYKIYRKSFESIIKTSGEDPLE